MTDSRKNIHSRTFYIFYKDQLEIEKLDYEITKHNFFIGAILPIEWVKGSMDEESFFLIVTKSSILYLFFVYRGEIEAK